jgi:hypothetical protein
MKIACVVVLLLCVTPMLSGCASKQEEGSGPPITAPINNNAPEAKNAPAAPGPGPDVPRPGRKGKM